MVTTDLIYENKRRIRGRKEVGEGKGEGKGVDEREKHSMGEGITETACSIGLGKWKAFAVLACGMENLRLEN